MNEKSYLEYECKDKNKLRFLLKLKILFIFALISILAVWLKKKK
jgi:hypothetical protein